MKLIASLYLIPKRIKLTEINLNLAISLYVNNHVPTLSHDYALDLFCYNYFREHSLPMLIF